MDGGSEEVKEIAIVGRFAIVGRLSRHCWSLTNNFHLVKSSGIVDRLPSNFINSLFYSMIYQQHHVEFFTATKLNWLPVLQNDFHKQILLEAIKHRVDNGQLTVYGFVIMPNHFHIIWRVNGKINKADFQRDFMKFTARSILKFMLMNNDPLLKNLTVKAADRKQQVWERNALSVELYTEAVFLQKLDYIHHNPLQPKWQLCNLPEEYFYSSAKFYETGGESDFGLLTHFRD